ncbi:hypothetical protein PF005_g15814 [Phytophthora fragariae]|uniref:Uncharacterized protein n=1 Tax=Phytophthora fragariae TaxID=53985 RepID=A0A6A3JUL9_9STRA|nr:hypothetical protein PF003_g11014 [Phytophthora fragariae]KAE8932652.1 hypothetical protein PF009_g17320 [Phytophthora fragariae]KAE8999026.1 hypothetical protein PF011_g14793 [Phytophthora fragariae]KAE9075088.1 hypothetical protein PF010_g24450 [Phytophthora fragariae]KAE9096580.1 hypothetical protein PF007_g16943 [Phytophthora fragariae]
MPSMKLAVVDCCCPFLLLRLVPMFPAHATAADCCRLMPSHACCVALLTAAQ